MKAARDSVKALLAVFATAPPFLLYMLFLGYLLQSLSITDPLETLIFYTQVVRLLALILVPGLRNGPAQVKLTLFSLEIFAIAALIVAFFVTGDIAYDQTMGSILVIWTGATLLVVSPYSILRLGWLMYRGTLSLVTLLVSSIIEFGIMFFVVDLIAGSSNPPQSLSGLGSLLVSSVVTTARSARPSVFAYHDFTLGLTVVYFVSLLLYSTVVHYPEGFSSRNVVVLVFPIAATLALLGWMTLLPIFTSNLLFILTIPSVLMSCLLWWATRDKK